MESKLYNKDLYTNKNIPFLFNKDIIEYDMKEAGYSLIKEFSLLPDKEIMTLSKLKKKQRTIEIGRLQRDREGFKKEFGNKFKEARKMFFELNDLEPQDIISIKKDAIFLNKRCKYHKITDNIDFREKNTYSSYIQLQKLELYYSHDIIDIKGISDDNLEKHRDGILKFIISFFNKMETSDDEHVIEFCKRTIDKYKHRKLPVEYYREFDFKSKYRTMDNELYEEYWEEAKDDLNISYNFQNILLKLIQIPL